MLNSVIFLMPNYSEAVYYFYNQYYIISGICFQSPDQKPIGKNRTKLDNLLEKSSHQFQGGVRQNSLFKCLRRFSDLTARFFKLRGIEKAIISTSKQT